MIDDDMREMLSHGSRVVFRLNAEQWEAFMTALDAPPYSYPRLERLLKEPSILEQSQTKKS
jgi:uncharacterized protein (DUF1778 family)